MGRSYDTTRKADPYLADRMIDLLYVYSGGKYLDVGCGSGNYTCYLSTKGINITGVDPSDEMLNKARSKDCNVNWINSSVEELDLKQTFDGVLISLSIHHWQDINKGFQKIAKHMEHGAKLVLFTSLPEQTKAYWLSNYFPKMIKESARKLPQFETILKSLNSAGIHILNTDKYFVSDELQDLFLNCGKNDPEKYFNEDIRRGISSFALAKDQNEIEEGLKDLRNDIDSGEITNIINRFENDLGD